MSAYKTGLTVLLGTFLLIGMIGIDSAKASDWGFSIWGGSPGYYSPGYRYGFYYGDGDPGYYRPYYYNRGPWYPRPYNPVVRRDITDRGGYAPDGSFHSETITENRHRSYYSPGRNQAITPPRTTVTENRGPGFNQVREHTSWIGADGRPHSTTIDRFTTVDPWGNTHTDTNVTLKNRKVKPDEISSPGGTPGTTEGSASSGSANPDPQVAPGYAPPPVPSVEGGTSGGSEGVSGSASN